MKYYDLHIGKGIGNINFNDSYQDIISLLGKPDKIFEEDILFALHYENLGLYFYYDKDCDKLDNLNIMTDKINYKNKNWYNLSKNKIFEIIKSICRNRNLEFEYDYDDDYSDKTKHYQFHNIGVSLFFKNKRLSNVSISEPLK